RSFSFHLIIIRTGTSVRQSGVVADGLIARSSSQMFSTSRFGAAEISNAGGRTISLLIGAGKEKAGLKFIPGLTSVRRKIDNAAGRSCARIGEKNSRHSRRILRVAKFTSQSISIVFVRRTP